MKFTCNQSTLSVNLAIASRAVASRPTQPVLGNIKIEADEKLQTVKLTGYDLSLAIQIEMAADVVKDGAITLPSKIFSDIVSKLPNEDVTIAVKKNAIIADIACGNGKYQINGLPVDEFPELPELTSDGQETTLPIGVMASGLSACLFATAIDETKRILTGVYITSDSEDIEFAATDGHRLSVFHSTNSFSYLQESETKPDPFSVTLPSRSLRELDRLLAQQPSGAITARFDSSHMIFQCANQTITTRILDGNYPNYRQLIPNAFTRTVAIKRKLLLSAVERIAVLANEKNNILKVSISQLDQLVTLSVEAPDVAIGRESIPAQITGEDLEIAFNVKYLLDGIRAISSSEIMINLNTPTSPVTITPIDADKMTYLLMPVQIRG